MKTKETDNSDMKIQYSLEVEAMRLNYDSGYEFDYLDTYTGKIFYKDENETEENLIGSLRFYHIRCVDAINNSISLSELLEGQLEEINDIAQEFWNFQNDEFIAKFMTVNDFGMPDIIIISRVIINEKYRGKGICLDVLSEIRRRFGCGKKIFMKPFPLQYEKTREIQKELEGLPKGNLRKHINKLSNYYEKAGFLKHKNIMYLISHD